MPREPGIILYAVCGFLISNVLSPNTCIGEEETLVRGETILVLQWLLSGSILEGIVETIKPPWSAKVLAEGETAVGIQIRQNLDVAEEISIHISTLVETFCIFSCPPVLQITASIILTTLIIEIRESSHDTDYYADSTIVECSISLRIEERILENTGWEADFVVVGL